MPLSKNCKCGDALVFHVPSGSWLCPSIKRSSFAGLIEPIPAYDDTGNAIPPEHITCMPAELWDDDFEVTSDHLRARGVSVETTPGDREAERRELQRQRAKESIAKLPATGPGSREQLNTYSCSDCGFRTPSETRMSDHLYREKHNFGEAPSGKRVHRPSAAGSVW